MKSMKRMSLSGLTVACMLAMAAPAMAADDMDVSLKDGNLKIKSGKNEFSVGGMIQADYVQYNEDFLSGSDAPIPGGTSRVAIEGYDSGADTRRLRLSVAGKIGEDWEFKFEHDFKEKATKDALLKYKGFGPAITAGQFYGFMGLEQQTSDRWVSYMERSLANNAFVSPFERRLGVGINGDFADQFMYGAALQFDRIDDAEESDSNRANFQNGNAGDDPMVYTVTVGWAPLNKETDKQLYFGLAYGYQDLKDTEAQTLDASDKVTGITLSSRADLRVDGTPTIVSTGALPADSYKLLNFQTAFIYGPFSMSGEYFDASIDGATIPTMTVNKPLVGTDRDYDGYYVEASYFLTGESRVFKWKDGKFDRPNVSKNAWEIAYRHSDIDLGDGASTAANSGSNKNGDAKSDTFAVNFYPNRTFKFSLNYTMADVDYTGARPDEDVNAWGARAQISF